MQRNHFVTIQATLCKLKCILLPVMFCRVDCCAICICMKITSILISFLMASTAFANDFLKLFPASGNECAASASILNSGKILSAGVEYTSGDVTLFSFSPEGIVQKAQRIHGPGQQEATAMISTKDGGAVMVGSTTSFSHGNSDGFIFKLRPNGSKAWAKTFGTAVDEFFSRVLQTPDSGYAVLGGISNTVTSFDVVLVKFSGGGKVLWKKTFSTPGFDHPSGIALTADGGILVIIASDVAAGTRTVVSKLSGNGNTQWTRIYGSGGTHVGLSIAESSDQNLYLTEIYTPAGSHISGTVLSKLDSQGLPVWSKLFRIRGNNFMAAVQLQTNPPVLLIGNASSGSTSKGILIALNSNGVVLWKKRISPDNRPVFLGPSVISETAGTIYNAGCVGDRQTNNMDTFLLQIHQNGQFQGGCSKLSVFPLTISRFNLQQTAFNLQELTFPYATAAAAFSISNFTTSESAVCSGQ